MPDDVPGSGVLGINDHPAQSEKYQAAPRGAWRARSAVDDRIIGFFGRRARANAVLSGLGRGDRGTAGHADPLGADAVRARGRAGLSGALSLDRPERRADREI